MTAEVGGPASSAVSRSATTSMEVEHSIASTPTPGVDQALIQASFDMDLSDTVRLQFGGMWHDYDGSQNAGWNRVTQDLIDNGTYITGTPIPLDTDLDGSFPMRSTTRATLTRSRFTRSLVKKRWISLR